MLASREQKCIELLCYCFLILPLYCIVREHLRLRLKTTSETEEQQFEASHGNIEALNNTHTNQSIVLALGIAKG